MIRMNGSTHQGKNQTLNVLVYEYVTGGGLAGQELPSSWAREGSAMRRAIARDFASVPGVRVVMTVDSRLPVEDLPGVKLRVMDVNDGSLFESLAAEVDYTVLIAPETDGILARLTGLVGQIGGKSLGSGRRGLSVVTDKARLAHHFYGNQIPRPETRMIGPFDRVLPGDWEGPSIVKPRMGAGSVNTVVVRDRQRPSWLTDRERAIAQPYLPGQPMSASFLVDFQGKSTLLGVGRQRIEVDPDGRISYQGGTILSQVQEAPPVVEAAIASVVDYYPQESLRGFVGVDYLEDRKTGVTVLEINPRPTTSYVGLSKMLGPGTIAGAWLDSMFGPLDATTWPDRIRALRTGPDISFLADGTLISQRAES
jgi:predicted ATP-grasp superfamily ATP-dependent carboligase